MRTVGKYDAVTIAKWFIAWADDVQVDDYDVTPMKLQKLLYYAQGHYLHDFGQPLFSDAIKAWSHGPVVPEVWHQFRGSGSDPISTIDIDDFSWDEIDDGDADFLTAVWNTYGVYSAARLRNMTHAESPWKAAWSRPGPSETITERDLRQFFCDD